MRLFTYKSITWEQFKNRYLWREDGYLYEWVNGCVEKTKRTINYSQIFISENLVKFFFELYNSGKVQGYLTNEVDTFFLQNLRRPNLYYLTSQQIQDGKNGIPPVPKFVIEIISNDDKAKRVQEKVGDYLRADVKVIWQIYPDLQVIHVYNGKKMTLLMDDDLCSAAPVLPEFVISVNDIFK